MRPDFNCVIFFAAKSEADLDEVCAAIQNEYQLPEFFFDWESTWYYGYSYTNKIDFNVTKTEEVDTISTWMPEAPNNINYQIRLAFFSEDKTQVNVEEVKQFLERILKAPVVKYYDVEHYDLRNL